MTSRVTYDENLRTTATHLNSSSKIETDAPIDNNGKGERFSPTDLLSTSLASCMITIMAIVAEKKKIPFHGVSASVTKFMASKPRRVLKIQIELDFPDLGYSEKQKKLLVKSAKECPVALSLSDGIEQDISFNFEG